MPRHQVMRLEVRQWSMREQEGEQRAAARGLSSLGELTVGGWAFNYGGWNAPELVSLVAPTLGRLTIDSVDQTGLHVRAVFDRSRRADRVAAERSLDDKPAPFISRSDGSGLVRPPRQACS